MRALHLVNHLPALDVCKSVAHSEDTILLIEDAVAAVQDDHDRILLALVEDLEVRRISPLGLNARAIDRREFVELVATHVPIVTWR